jgi:hypothetical protein
MPTDSASQQAVPARGTASWRNQQNRDGLRAKRLHWLPQHKLSAARAAGAGAKQRSVVIAAGRRLGLIASACAALQQC